MKTSRDRARDTALPIGFEKWTGAGNDFVLLAAADLPPGLDGAELARRLCRRGFSIGADGLIVLAGSRARYWNVDGSPAAFCGNGARCTARRLLEESGAARVTFELGAVESTGWFEEGEVAVAVPAPRGIGRGTALLGACDPAPLGTEPLQIASVAAGVPHLILRLGQAPAPGWTVLAAGLQGEAAFAPDGVNVTCVWPEGGALALRTWERGVRDETLACGSAALAAAWLAGAGHANAPVVLRTPGGSRLTVKIGDGGWILRGPAERVCRGLAWLPS